jgi:hypothetical protein
MFAVAQPPLVGLAPTFLREVFVFMDEGMTIA